MGGGGANLGIDQFIGGGGGTMHFKVMGVGGWPLLLPPPLVPMPTVYFNWEVGNFICFIGNRNSTI